MPFAKGTPKPKGSGRKKGQIGKLSTEVLERLEQLGFDPIQNMVSIANDKETPVEVRGKMCSELAQYVWPKRKALEHSGLGVHGGSPQTFIAINFVGNDGDTVRGVPAVSIQPGEVQDSLRGPRRGEVLGICDGSSANGHAAEDEDIVYPRNTKLN